MAINWVAFLWFTFHFWDTPQLGPQVKMPKIAEAAALPQGSHGWSFRSAPQCLITSMIYPCMHSEPSVYAELHPYIQSHILYTAQICVYSVKYTMYIIYIYNYNYIYEIRSKWAYTTLVREGPVVLSKCTKPCKAIGPPPKSDNL